MDRKRPKGSRLHLTDQELLKELLRALGVRGEVDLISEAAIHEFGSIQATLRQASEDLKKIKGFTPTVIKRLKTIYSLFREINKPEGYPLQPTRRFEDLSYFMFTTPKFDGESVRLLFLDENQGILKDYIYKKGSGNQVKFYFREIVKEVLKTGISSLVLIHHKIGASPNPSLIDLERFKEFNNGFKALDMKLVDYLLISENALFSFKDKKVYPPSHPTQ
jgi:DNA repair protein RadC